MKTPALYFLIFLCITVSSASAQVHSVKKNKKIDAKDCIFQIDTFYILPSSVIITVDASGEIINDSLYSLDFNTSLLSLSDSICKHSASLSVSYQTIAIPVGFMAQRKKPLKSIDSTEQGFEYVLTPSVPFDPFASDGLIKNGNISRGISVGNTQGASLQSSLDIRLSGKLNNDVDIVAVITDNNIPIQPDGNTRQLQEFDKVFVELSKDRTKARVGDLEQRNPDSYFLKYFKKTQGGMFQTSLLSQNSVFSGDSSVQNMYISGGISKGKFARKTFTGINGNQGPYKLTGAENEMFIIILAGTEKVHINGEQMTRGHNYDYVIDYNTAELSFTTNRLITSDSRIVIEFEYSDKNYVRSLFTGGYDYDDSKTTFSFHFYSEQDAKNQPLQQTLEEEDRYILQMAGDNPLAAVAPGWDSVAFSGDYVLYAMIDTLGYDSVFVYSIDSQFAAYRVSFSFVGQGNGHYIQDRSLANGRVFKWVEPLGSIPQGDYQPYIILVAPKKQQMATLGFSHQFNKKTLAGAELALSNQDLNTFSVIDNQNNSGVAGKVFFRHTSFLQSDSLLAPLLLQKEISYEFTEARFTAVDRFRPVEFNRDWNIQENENITNDHIFGASLRLLNNKKLLASYRADYFINSQNFNGLKNVLFLNLQKGIFKFRSDAMYMTSEKTSFTSSFFKQKSKLWAVAGPVAVGSAIEQEVNYFRLMNDSLLRNSYRFFEYEPFIESVSDTAKFHFRLWFNQRNTYQMLQNPEPDPAFYSREYGLRINTGASSMNRIALTGAYRSIYLQDTTITNVSNDNALVSRLEHNLYLFEGAISSFLYYEVASGMESKKEFSYLEVAPGQGQYTWIDYNMNGIKELDEFEPANYQDEANYIRILLPSTEYIKAYTMLLNETFMLDPSRAWRADTSSWKKTLSRFSNRFQFSMMKKTTSDNTDDRFIPTFSSLYDSSLVSLNSGINNTFFFNRAHPVFSMRYRYSDNINKMLMLNGFEFRRMISNELQIVWNMTKTLGTDIELRMGNRENKSDLSFTRNYNIQILELFPRIHFQPNMKQRFSLMSRYKDSKNSISGSNEHATLISLGPEARFPVADKHTFNIRLTYHYIKYNSDLNTPLAFEMLESLEPGTNFTWNVTMQYAVSKSLHIHFMYEGRKPEGKNIIHFGSVQLKALL